MVCFHVCIITFCHLFCRKINSNFHDIFHFVILCSGQDSWRCREFGFLSSPHSSCSWSGTRPVSPSLSPSLSPLDSLSPLLALPPWLAVSLFLGLWRRLAAPLESCVAESSEAERTDVRRRNFLPSLCSSLPLASLSPCLAAWPLCKPRSPGVADETSLVFPPSAYGPSLCILELGSNDDRPTSKRDAPRLCED